ncbi:ABC transporter permease [Cytobacillus purgationiresistens]|uniref:ABC-2 type transport system permease protein n=1 Tax=Cytobacillus purgationiresistens TaxID=863449 RepID=A0ABU0AM49_9BACI|nr:ABC transporter permease [Cytobacillus purgationiresistens]MDQ0271473.1 ABC-2 type transport system permease protein [Cytobacillus purgationiresistens]
MNILNIYTKEMKSDFRDSQTFIFFLAFPIILMIILGTALSNAFTSGITLDEITVLYKSDGNEELLTHFQGLLYEAGKQGFTFEEAEVVDAGIQAVEENQAHAFIVLNDAGIDIYGSDLNTIETSIIHGMMTAFADQYNLYQQQIDLDQASSVPHDYIQHSSLNGAKQPDSMDYYAVAMAVMISFFSLYASYNLFRGEKTLRTGDRLMAAPIAKSEILIGKVAATFSMNAFFLLIMIFFSKYVFNAEWGDHLLVVITLLFSLILFAICLGIAISFIAKTPEATATISVLFVQVACFLGGVYFPIDTSSGGLFSFFASLSPLTWSNEAIREVIYGQNPAAAYPVILLNLCIAGFCYFITVFYLRRQEGL